MFKKTCNKRIFGIVGNLACLGVGLGLGGFKLIVHWQLRIYKGKDATHIILYSGLAPAVAAYF